jgi:NADH-quinone oxidoreductase subunit A
MREYLPVLMFIIVGIGFAGVTLGVSQFIVPRRSTAKKMAPYECGVEPVGTARQRVEIKFYLVAVLFILFDIEAVFLYPWAVAFRRLGLYGLIEMVLFVAVLLVGYLYLLQKKALDWNSPS